MSCKCQILQRPLKEWPRFMALAFLIVLYRALISTCSQANHNPTKAHTKKKKKEEKHPTFIPKGKKEDNKLANRILKIQTPDGRNVMIY